MIKLFLKHLLYRINVSVTCKFDFRNYWLLSRKLRWPILSDKSGIQGNYCYGNLQAVKLATGDDFDPHCMIEHGIYFGRNVLEEECIYPEISTIYTYSPYRLEVLREHFGNNFDKNIVSVGPYVCYANHLMSERKRLKLKEKWGKTLLVFPSHSSPEENLSFDYDEWIKEIDRRAEGYDTIVICLFWLDILLGNHKYYLNRGYVLACCGNRLDPNFLSRQKDIISLADMTMSNDIGTNIGYCISMGKPHYIFRQSVGHDVYNKKNKDTDYVGRNRKQEYDELYSLFSTFQEKITKEQANIVNYYWGAYIK